MTTAQYLSIITVLIPIVMFLVEFIKKQFNLDGNAVKLTSLIVSSIVAAAYCIIFSLVWWIGVLLAIGLTCSACGGYDLLKELLTTLGKVKN